MDLVCTEVLYRDSQEEDDLGLGGLRSLPDPALLTDKRVLENVLLGGQGNNHTIVDYFSLQIQRQIKPHMRKIVADWMLEVTEEQKCSPEVFSLAINYMDRVLSLTSIDKSQFQLLASVCIFLASKFKESSPLCADKLVIYSDFCFSTEEIMRWELVVLKLLDWDLSAITPFCILDQLMRRMLLTGVHTSAVVDFQAARNLAETLVTLAVTETAFLTTQPILVAVSSLITALSHTLTTHESQILLADFVKTLLDVSGLGVEEVTKVMLKIEDTILSMRLNNNNKNQNTNTFCSKKSTSSNSSSVVEVSNATSACVC